MTVSEIVVYCFPLFVFSGSPLIVILRELLNLDILKINGHYFNNTVSFLLGIFRAIQKAEDAINPDMTPV